MRSSAVFLAALASLLPFAVADAAQGDNTPLTYQVVQPDTLVSAMMMGLIDETHVFLLDKVENNPHPINNAGKPTWGAIMDLTDYSMRGVEVNTNTFCASGAVLGNGTWVVAGGNNVTGYGGGPVGVIGGGPYYDFDGRRAIRLMEPTTDPTSMEWIDDPNSGLQLATPRWYPAVEVLSTGEAVFVGGAVNGGYVNRNYPNTDPAYQGGGNGSPTNINGGANPTFEYWPPRDGPIQESQFMITTSGLNMYAHTYLMPSGKIFMQANYSTILWDHDNNKEYKLPQMTKKIVRVYPASAATAMLPLTPANNYTPTILFCGGTVLDDQTWGSYGGPGANILSISASTDCSSITPENADGTQNPDVAYDSEEQMDTGRTMGQFVHLPTGQMLIVNGANKGTAGYYNSSFNQFTINGQPLYTEGLAQDPTYQPLLYDPSLPKGSRLSNANFGSSQTARLYHSSALLLPDGGVLIAGSNPHVDSTLTMPSNFQQVQVFNTSYEAEIWRPDYYFKERPQPQGLPTQLMYGGDSFNVTMDADYMGSSANYKANATKFMVIRPGFSNHAMQFGQRSLQLDNTYIVNSDGSVTYMVNPLPTNLNLVVPGPALLFVTIDGVPSLGKFIMCGDMTGPVPGKVTVGADLAQLPSPINNSKFDADPTKSAIQNFGIGKIIGVAAAGVAIIAVIALGVCLWRRRARRSNAKVAGAGGAAAGAAGGWAARDFGIGGGNAAYKPVQGAGAGSIHSYGARDPFNANASAVSLTSGNDGAGGWDAYRLNRVGSPAPSGNTGAGYFDTPVRVASPAFSASGSQGALGGAAAGAAGGAAAAGAASKARSPLTLAPLSPGEGGDGFGGAQRVSQYQTTSRGPSPNQAASQYQTPGWGEHQAGDPGAYHQSHGASSASQGYSDQAGAYYDQPSHGGGSSYGGGSYSGGQEYSPALGNSHQQSQYQQQGQQGYSQGYSQGQQGQRGYSARQASYNDGSDAGGYAPQHSQAYGYGGRQYQDYSSGGGPGGQGYGGQSAASYSRGTDGFDYAR